MLSCAYILSLSMIGNFPNTQSFGTFPLFPRIWEIFEIFLKTTIRFWQKFGQSEKLPKNTDIWETSQLPSHSQNSQNFPNPFETPQDGMSGGRHTTPFFRPHQKKKSQTQNYTSSDHTFFLPGVAFKCILLWHLKLFSTLGNVMLFNMV